MTALFWSSYLVLAFTVLALVFATAFLYRLIGKPNLVGLLPLVWPLKGIKAGGEFPPLMLRPYRQTFGVEQRRIHNGLILLTSGKDAFAAAYATLAASLDMHCEAHVIVRDGDSCDWCPELPPSFDAQIFVADKTTFDQFGASPLPVVLSIVNGKVMDAMTALNSPRLVKQSFSHMNLLSGVETLHRT